MGYLIKQQDAELVKFETNILRGDMQQLATVPYALTATQKVGFVFTPVSAFIQVNGTLPYNTFSNLWIVQPGGTEKNATFQRVGSNNLNPNTVCAFIVNIAHGTIPINIFGNRVVSNRDFELSMNIDDTSGDGDGLVTIYGYYLPIFI